MINLFGCFFLYYWCQTCSIFTERLSLWLQVTGPKALRAIWTTLQPATTTAQFPAPRRASAWKHALAFWTCDAHEPIKTQSAVPRKRSLARPSSWSKECEEQKELFRWSALDSFWTLETIAVHRLAAITALISNKWVWNITSERTLTVVVGVY